MPSLADRGENYHITPENHAFRESYNASQGWIRPTPKKIHYRDTPELAMLDAAPSGHVMRSFAGAVARHKTQKLAQHGYPKSHHSGAMETPDGVILASETVHAPRKGGYPLIANSHSYHVSHDSRIPSSYRHERAVIHAETEEKPDYQVVSSRQFGSHEELTQHLQTLHAEPSMKKSLARIVTQLDEKKLAKGLQERRLGDRRSPTVRDVDKEPHVPVKVVAAFAGMASRHAAAVHPEFGKPIHHGVSVLNSSVGSNPGISPHTVLMGSTAHYEGGHQIHHSYILGPGDRAGYSAVHVSPTSFAPNHLKSEEFRHPDEVAAHMHSLLK